ncbi:MAG: VPDSG-CTERM sorting domain-containing protein [Opitutaceae bacterium]
MKLKFLSVLIASLAVASISHGLTWTTSYGYNQGSFGPNPIVFLDGTPNSYTNSLSLPSVGFNPATMDVTSATITFWFADDDSDGSEQVDITVEGVQAANDMEVDGSHPQANFASYAFVLNAAQLATLNTDGIANYTVGLVTGDTYLKIVSITASGPSTVTAPDGGTTVALLGIGFIGLAAIRKRFGAKL